MCVRQVALLVCVEMFTSANADSATEQESKNGQIKSQCPKIVRKTEDVSALVRKNSVRLANCLESQCSPRFSTNSPGAHRVGFPIPAVKSVICRPDNCESKIKKPRLRRTRSMTGPVRFESEEMRHPVLSSFASSPIQCPQSTETSDATGKKDVVQVRTNNKGKRKLNSKDNLKISKGTRKIKNNDITAGNFCNTDKKSVATSPIQRPQKVEFKNKANCKFNSKGTRKIKNGEIATSPKGSNADNKSLAATQFRDLQSNLLKLILEKKVIIIRVGCTMRLLDL